MKSKNIKAIIALLATSCLLTSPLTLAKKGRDDGGDASKTKNAPQLIDREDFQDATKGLFKVVEGFESMPTGLLQSGLAEIQLVNGVYSAIDPWIVYANEAQSELISERYDITVSGERM